MHFHFSAWPAVSTTTGTMSTESGEPDESGEPTVQHGHVEQWAGQSEQHQLSTTSDSAQYESRGTSSWSQSQSAGYSNPDLGRTAEHVEGTDSPVRAELASTTHSSDAATAEDD